MKNELKSLSLFGLCGLCAAMTLVGLFVTSQPGRADQVQVGNIVAVKTVAKTVEKTVPAKARTGTKTQAKKQPKGAFARWLRRVIPGKKGRIIPKKRAKFHIPDDPKARAKSIRARDHIDSRAPHDPDDIKRLRRAEERIEARDYKLAVLIIQHLLDRKDDSMIRNERGEWVSVRQRVNELMAKQPEAFHRFYRVKYGAQARIDLADALKTGDRQSLAEVATRFFHTESGLDASRRLAVLALDRGEYGIAARWYARLLQSKHAGAGDPLWMLQAAYAYRRSGDSVGADALMARIESVTEGKSITVGDRKIVPREWLKKFTEEKTGPSEMREWWVLFGNASRNGRAVGGDPLLLSRWSKRLTHSHAVKEKIKRVLQTLRDNNRALIPASIPLAVDGRIVFRTLRGVLVVDAETGQAQWESRVGISAEKLLATSSSSQSYSRFGGGIIRSRSGRTTGTNADFHPATGLLFRNGTHGMLSSDGKQLFVIEKMALLPNINYSRYSSFNPAQNDRYRRSWLTNKLTAYDLKTGRPNWELGGRQQKESFDLPLAGTFFLGVPVADKGELFVIGERDNRVRLHVIDAKTGKPKWSRLIAYSDTKISQDSVRRWLSAQVAVKNGVIVCPTTVGWMIGVDRTNGAVLWGHRYSKPAGGGHEPERASNNLDGKPLNERWLTSAPVIASGHVVYTPQEDETVVCVRLRDGKRAWKIPKSDYLYLAGVFEGNVVLVGKTAVTAVSLAKGSTVWTQKLSKKVGPPSGMGVAAGSRYHLPLHSGQLWTIDVISGAVTKKSYLPKSAGTLGNLVMYRGQVVSLTPTGLTSYEQRDALLAEIKRRKAKRPDDAWSALKEAEIALLGRKYDESLAYLKRVNVEQLDDATKPRYRLAMLRTLSEMVRSDFKKHDAHFARLKTFARSDKERFALQRLAAERHEARGELVDAFKAYRDLADNFDDRVIRRSQQGHVELSARHWSDGKLRDLWARMAAVDRKRLDTIVGADVTAAGNKVDRLIATIARYEFHPKSVSLVHEVVDSLAKAGRFAEAENQLLRLAARSNGEVAAAALERLGRLLESRDLPRDAAVVYERMLRQYPSVKLPNGRTVRRHVAIVTNQGRIKAESKSQPVSWANEKLALEESGTNYRSYPDQQIDLSDSPYPYFSSHSFVVDRTDQQLLVRDIANDKMTWLAPLRANNQYANGYYVFSQTYGHCLLVLHDRILQCLSPVDRRILWSRPVSTSGANVYYSYYSSLPVNRPTQPLGNGDRVAAIWKVARTANQVGGIAFANERCIGVFGRRRLEVLDAVTGVKLWTLGGLTPANGVLATTEAVYVIDPRSSATTVLRASDGTRLDGVGSAKLAKKTVGVYGRYLLVADDATTSFLGLKRSEMTWKLLDPLSGKTVWQRRYQTGVKHGLLSDGTIAALHRDGSLELLDPQTGAASKYALGRDFKSGTTYVLQDRDSVFVSASGRNHGGFSYGGVKSVYLSGTMTAFDRRSRKKLWSRDLKTQLGLVIDEFARSPVLTYMSQKYQRIGRIGMQKIHVKLFDKRTGRALFERESPSTNSYGAFTVNLKERFVELSTYNYRMRIVAAEPPREAIRAPRPRRRPVKATR